MIVFYMNECIILLVVAAFNERARDPELAISVAAILVLTMIDE